MRRSGKSIDRAKCRGIAVQRASLNAFYSQAARCIQNCTQNPFSAHRKRHARRRRPRSSPHNRSTKSSGVFGLTLRAFWARLEFAISGSENPDRWSLPGMDVLRSGRSLGTSSIVCAVGTSRTPSCQLSLTWRRHGISMSGLHQRMPATSTVPAVAPEGFLWRRSLVATLEIDLPCGTVM